VKEYLKFVADMRGASKERIAQVAESCGIAKVMDKPIDELSKGYRQRVGLAQAIMGNPDVLILDEPTTGLDPNQIAEIRELIKKIGSEKTVIFSTHILAEAGAVCDRVIIINNGKIVGEGAPDELIKKAKSKETVYIKVEGPKAAVLAVLSKVSGVAKATLKDEESESVFGYEIEAADGKDVRAALTTAVVSGGWNIMEITKSKASLEDVFRELTK
jgi:ABC-2 type transport system ATP-binding protein